jgi:hypothetical protein
VEDIPMVGKVESAFVFSYRSIPGRKLYGVSWPLNQVKNTEPMDITWVIITLLLASFGKEIDIQLISQLRIGFLDKTINQILTLSPQA